VRCPVRPPEAVMNHPERPVAKIRPALRTDNPAVAGIIRDVMTEFGAVGRDYSISDPEVEAMFEAYPAPVPQTPVRSH